MPDLQDSRASKRRPIAWILGIVAGLSAIPIGLVGLILVGRAWNIDYTGPTHLYGGLAAVAIAAALAVLSLSCRIYALATNDSPRPGPRIPNAPGISD